MNGVMRLRTVAFQWLLAVGSLSCLAGCEPINVQPSSIDVEGRIRGQDGAFQPQEDAVISLRHDGTTATRISYRRGIGIQHVQSVRLAATASTGLPFSERWHLFHLTHDGQRPGSEPTFVDFTGDPGWVRSHQGNLAWLTLRKDDIALPSSTFDNFPASTLRSGGSVTLARVEDDDPVLPWTSTMCAATATLPLAATLRPLAAAGGGDCFDMQSLASLVLNQVALTVTDAARMQNARALSHSLAIVPHIETAATGGGATRPGIGFIYTTTLEPLVLGVGVGGFTGTLDLSVPITWVFGRLPPGNTVVTALDPITAPVLGTVLGNGPRITVRAVEGSISSAVAEQLRAGVLAGITAAPIPTGPGGIPIASFLDLLLTLTVLGNQPALPANFSVLAVPANQAVAGAPRNTAIRMGEITFSERTGVAPPLAGGRGARSVAIAGDGTVRVLDNINAAGTNVRVFSLPAPVEPLPFNLVVQR